VVVGMPANGLSSFVMQIGHRLARLGHLVIVPDYYGGAGPADPDALDGPHSMPHLSALMGGLDFPQAAGDLILAARAAGREPGVTSVAVWGYCTGATVATLAGCLGGGVVDRLVLFYPSQMIFPELSRQRPQSPVELLWALQCPTLLLVGADDPLWPEELVRRVDDVLGMYLGPRGIGHEVVVYPGAGHTFSDHWSDGRTDSYRPEADADSWARATAFVSDHRRDT
jgi:carboxymethylenebutenolidase